VSSAAGDNTPQIIDAQGQSVMPSAVAYHPVTGEIKKITGAAVGRLPKEPTGLSGADLARLLDVASGTNITNSVLQWFGLGRAHRSTRPVPRGCAIGQARRANRHDPRADVPPPWPSFNHPTTALTEYPSHTDLPPIGRGDRRGHHAQ
jgi:hypothetical protein